MSAKPAPQISARIRTTYNRCFPYKTQTQHCGFRAAEIQLIFYSCKKNVINAKKTPLQHLQNTYSSATLSKKCIILVRPLHPTTAEQILINDTYRSVTKAISARVVVGRLFLYITYIHLISPTKTES